MKNYRNQSRKLAKKRLREIKKHGENKTVETLDEYNAKLRRDLVMLEEQLKLIATAREAFASDRAAKGGMSEKEERHQIAACKACLGSGGSN